jgi:hypothetical protein
MDLADVFTCHYLFLFSFSFLFFSGEGPRSRRYGRTAAMRLIVQPYDGRWWLFFVLFLVMEHRWNEIDRGKPKNSGKKPVPVPFCPRQIPHGLTPGSNPGLRGGRPAANRLSHGTAWDCLELVDGASKLIRNVGYCLLNCMTSYLWTLESWTTGLFPFDKDYLLFVAHILLSVLYEISGGCMWTQCPSVHPSVRQWPSIGAQAVTCRPTNLLKFNI